ncbi:Uncharacterised protein [Clostridioides difficile]|nr:Uncharacterised protein [Clostridioides difficile]
MKSYKEKQFLVFEFEDENYKCFLNFVDGRVNRSKSSRAWEGGLKE